MVHKRRKQIKTFVGSSPEYSSRCHHFATCVTLNLHHFTYFRVLPHMRVSFSFTSYNVNRGFDPLLFPSEDLVLAKFY